MWENASLTVKVWAACTVLALTNLGGGFYIGYKAGVKQGEHDMRDEYERDIVKLKADMNQHKRFMDEQFKDIDERGKAAKSAFDRIGRDFSNGK